MSQPTDRAELVVLARDAQWRRLDPRMLLVHPVNELVRFLPALVGVFLIGQSGDGHTWWHLGAVAVPVALGLLRFLTTRFRITAGQLELQRGLLSRSVLTAPLDRVRTVELTSSLIHRFLGLAKVEIGTGSAQKRGEDKLELNSLRLAEARALRAALLHRVAASDPVAGGVVGEDVDGPSPTVREPARDVVLLRLDPRWTRFAPLTTSGLAIALGALAAGNQLVQPLIQRVRNLHTGEQAATVPIWVVGLAAVIAFLLLISVLSVCGYLLTNWGFTLSRDSSGRSIHVAKGLLTTRETSIEMQRLHGVEIHEPLGLRLAGGRRLTAIATGLSRRESGSTALVPPAPRDVVVRVAEGILGSDGPLAVQLTPHGAAATRRRYLRAVFGGVMAAVVLGLAIELLGANSWWLLATTVPVLAAFPLARDRAARLGHALTGTHLVLRAHSFHGRRDALQRSGIIGWNIEQSWFQRRVGVVNLTATTSAGKQGYTALDIPEGEALRIADQAVPDLLTPFLL